MRTKNELQGVTSLGSKKLDMSKIIILIFSKSFSINTQKMTIWLICIAQNLQAYAQRLDNQILRLLLLIIFRGTT